MKNRCEMKVFIVLIIERLYKIHVVFLKSEKTILPSRKNLRNQLICMDSFAEFAWITRYFINSIYAFVSE